MEPETPPVVKNDNKQLVAAILVAGVLIAGAILLKGSTPPNPKIGEETGKAAVNIKAVSASDQMLGDPKAPVTLIMYEDFQCPWCGKIHMEAEKAVRDKYVSTGKVNLVYRDFAFLGTFVEPYIGAKDESVNTAQAARCAADQGKFWEYHDFIFEHQNGENGGNFSNANLKGFAKGLGLESKSFDTCLDSNKYAKAVADSKEEGKSAGVKGTPAGFIVKNGKVVDTIEGYITSDRVLDKIASALK